MATRPLSDRGQHDKVRERIARRDEGISPNSKSSQDSAGQKHADVDRRGLDGGADGHHHAHELHEADAAESVADEGLSQRADRLASDVNGDDLTRTYVRTESLTQQPSLRKTYRARQALGWIFHVVDPALMCNGWHHGVLVLGDNA